MVRELKIENWPVFAALRRGKLIFLSPPSHRVHRGHREKNEPRIDADKHRLKKIL
jgi:hypothetical protein